MISRKNFSGEIVPDTGDELEFTNCNFSHPNAIDVGGGVFEGVRIWPGDDRPRVFTDCNLINMRPPPGSTFSGGNTAISTITAETETLIIDGQTYEEEVYFRDTLGRMLPDLTYQYLPEPERSREI